MGNHTAGSAARPGPSGAPVGTTGAREGGKVKLTVEKLPVVLGVLIGLSEMLEEGLVTGDWLYRAVPFALVRARGLGLAVL